MPLLVSFRGRPVKHRRRIPAGLLIIFFSSVRGQRGSVTIVSQDEWRRHGTLEFFPPHRMPDVRALAARFEHPSL